MIAQNLENDNQMIRATSVESPFDSQEPRYHSKERSQFYISKGVLHKEKHGVLLNK